jgi:hypothetical protein
MAVAIAEAFGTALAGRGKQRPELAETAIPLVVSVSVLPSYGGEEFIRKLFEPLDYSVKTTRLVLGGIDCSAGRPEQRSNSSMAAIPVASRSRVLASIA